MKKLPKKKIDVAVSAIMANPRLQDAAEALGVGYSTLWRWMQEPELRQKLAEARQGILIGTITVLQEAMGMAVQVLTDVMADPENAASSRIAAARTTLDMAYKGLSIIELEGRIKVLEEKTLEGEKA